MHSLLLKLFSRNTGLPTTFIKKYSVFNRFFIRTLQIEEFKNLLNNWPVKEGWNPGKYEYVPFYEADPHGHKGLFIDNKLIASLSTVRYSQKIAFLGLYIVDPEYRDQGIGQNLVKSAAEEIIDYPIISINAVQSQVGNYQRKYGVKPSYTNSRYIGYFKPENQAPHKKPEMRIVSKENIDINQLIDYDANIFSVSRETFLRPWIEMPESKLLWHTK